MPAGTDDRRELAGAAGRYSPASSISGLDNPGLELYVDGGDLTGDLAGELPADRPTIAVISESQSTDLRKVSLHSIDQPVYLLQGSAGQLIAVPSGYPGYTDVSSKLFTQKPRFNFSGATPGTDRKGSRAELILSADFQGAKEPHDSDIESASSSEADWSREKRINRCMKALGIFVIFIFVVVVMIIIITVIMKQANQTSEER